MTDAWGYVRLSQSGRDASLEEQKQAIREYARAEGLNLQTTRNDGENTSGFDTDRPEYQLLREKIETEAIDAVIVRDRARLSRDFDERIRLIILFRLTDVDCHDETLRVHSTGPFFGRILCDAYDDEGAQWPVAEVDGQLYLGWSQTTPAEDQTRAKEIGSVEILDDGEEYEQQKLATDGGTERYECWSCSGEGEKERPGDRVTDCIACAGSGRITESKIRQMWRDWKADEPPEDGRVLADGGTGQPGSEYGLDCPDCGETFHSYHDESAVSSLRYHLKRKHPDLWEALRPRDDGLRADGSGETGKDRFDGQPVGLDENLNQWSWGRVVTPDGEFIPPGACDGMHNKDQQREVFDR